MLLYQYLWHMGCYYTLCHNTYAFSLLFYKVYIKRENADSWDSGMEKEQILETYSAQLQKSWNFMEDVFQIYKKYWEQELHQGGHTLPTRVGGVPPCLMASSKLPWCLLQVSWIAFIPKITLLKVSFRLDSVWYSFSSKHWNKGKNRNWHWGLG